MDMRTAIVTGAGQGIGRAIAQALAKTGIHVAVADINMGTAEHTAAEINAAGGVAIPIGADVSRTEDIGRMAQTTIKTFGSVDILVNNAGILHTTAIEKITEEEWDKIMAVNLKGTFFAIQEVLPYMREKQHGRIINISSLAGRMGGYANGVAYSASKAGIIGLTMAVARRVAAYGITVNAIAPGTTETDIVKQLSDEQMESLRQSIPLKRLGKPGDIAAVAAFLASDGAGFITGAVIDVNGGMFMG